ncbi:WD domain, G-beta repeat protein, partial [Ostertagia ostertagi]
MFGSSSSFGAKPSIFGSTTATTATTNPNAEDIAVEGSPDDTVQVLRFSPNPNEKPLLAAGSWDGVVRVWMVNDNGQCEGKAQQNIPAPVLDLSWTDGITTLGLMTGSWDKTLRFWDMRQLPTQSSLANITLPERVYCADVLYPMAAVGLANRHIKVYNLENGPQEVKNIESQLKFQHRCVSIFKDKTNSMPCGFAVGSIE